MTLKITRHVLFNLIKIVPFNQVVALKFSRSVYEVQYKTSFTSLHWKKVLIREYYRPSRNEYSNKIELKMPACSSITKSLPQNKVHLRNLGIIDLMIFFLIFLKT